jgi:hypothetical protein
MSAVRCNGCGNEIVEIMMERGESTFVLQSCSICDQRIWQRDGEEVPLDGVLARINDVETRS